MVRKFEFIDLRHEVRYLQERYSFFWVALRSSQLNQKCFCLDSFGMPSPSCARCMSTGYLFVDKLVKAQVARGAPGSKLITKIGNINNEFKTWTIESSKKPKASDWILELDLDEKTGSPKQPFSIRRAFKIESVSLAGGKKGRVAYWKCYSTERNLTVGLPSRPTIAPATKELASIYNLNIWNNQLISKSLELSSSFTFTVRNISGVDKSLSLSPKESPPSGKLLLKLKDNTITNIKLNKQ